MKLKKYACRCIAVVCAVVSVACQENIETIDKINTEVSVLQERTILPLGSFEGATLGDLIGDTELPAGLERTEEGYEFKIDTTISPEIDFEIPSSYDIPGTSSEIPVSLPKLSLDGMTFDISTDAITIPALSAFGTFVDIVGDDNSSIEITDDIFHNDYFEFPSHIEIKSEEPTSVEIDPVEFDLPEQITDITRVVLAKEEGEPGAPIVFDLELNGLAGVNKGGSIDFTLAPKGNIELVLYSEDSVVNGEYIPVGKDEEGKYLVNHKINEDDSTAILKFYIAEVIILPSEETDGGVETVDATASKSVNIDLSMDCDFNFVLDLMPGTLGLKNEDGSAAEPTFMMSADIGLEDAFVKFNTEKPLFSFDNKEGFDFDIEGLPEQLKSINKIQLKDTELKLFAEGLEWLNDAGYGNVVSIDMTLPKEFVITTSAGEYDAESGKLSMTLGDIANGIDIVLEAIDFGESGLAPDENGKISIAFRPEVEVRFSNSDELSVMGFFPPEESINIKIGFDDAKIGLESVSAEVDFSYSYEPEKPFETGLGDMTSQLEGLTIGGAGLSPVIELSLSNPLTIAANFYAAITPLVGEERKDDAKIEVKGDNGGPIEIPAATYNEQTGEVTPANIKIVLAKPNRAADFADCIFIGCDIDKLINLLPTHFDIDVDFSLPSEPVTLHMIEKLDMDIALKLSLPIAFDDGLSLSYEFNQPIVENGESPLQQIADIKGLKVGDIAVISKFETTLPLELAATTRLLDKDGNELKTKLGFGDENNNRIKGSKDGETPEVSELRFVFDLAAEDGSLAELADIHTIAVKVEANSVADDMVYLKDEQYIKADLTLEIDGGVTINIDELTNN